MIWVVDQINFSLITRHPIGSLPLQEFGCEGVGDDIRLAGGGGGGGGGE